VSTYEKEAIISLYNQSEKGIQLDYKEHSHFLKNLYASFKISKSTAGHFDPTVMPLVNYWGFGYSGHDAIENVDTAKINAILQVIGMSKVVSIEETLFLFKSAPDVQLDFSALAKGYGVDEVCLFLEKKGVEDYFVEIGGELRIKGRNPRGLKWTVGVNKPEEKSRLTDFMFRVQPNNEALATSGNYRNVYEVDGIKYFHTINPFTGYPQRNRLLSASVLAKDCMTADAYATAFMVMGLDKAYDLATKNDDIKAAFIYSDEAGVMQLKSTEDFELLAVTK